VSRSGVSPDDFVRRLREEVRYHPAVTHPFLARFAAGGLARWQIWGYASQHYRLVCFFTAYLEAVAARTPDPQVREWLDEILEDEYVRSQSFKRSHPALYRRFLRAIGFEEGAWETVPWLPATHAFVQTHIDLTLRSWLLGLGAIGPQHEWAIPLMFPSLLTGIQRSLSLDRTAPEYLHLHIDLDVEHGRVPEDAMRRWATTAEPQTEIHRGARCSLAARAAFWGALAEQLFPEVAAITVRPAAPAGPAGESEATEQP
jgi:pyrroloquinoline-quinone synthase